MCSCQNFGMKKHDNRMKQPTIYSCLTDVQTSLAINSWHMYVIITLSLRVVNNIFLRQVIFNLRQSILVLSRLTITVFFILRWPNIHLRQSFQPFLMTTQSCKKLLRSYIYLTSVERCGLLVVGGADLGRNSALPKTDSSANLVNG